MSVKNVNGHGVTNQAGAVHQEVVPAKQPDVPNVARKVNPNAPGVVSGTPSGGPASRSGFPPAK